MRIRDDKNFKLKRINDHYVRRIHPQKAGFDVLDWGSREAQVTRFETLLSIIQRNPTVMAAESLRVLDVGCGLTDLHTFFASSEFPVDYLGVDITLPVLMEAKRRHPGRKILQTDVFTDAPFAEKTFDVIFCSGIFNLKLGNNDRFAAYALEQLIPLSKHLVVANFLHQRTSRKYPHCFYYDPDELQKTLEKLPCQAEVVDDYLENDFTIVLKCPPVVSSLPPVELAQK